MITRTIMIGLFAGIALQTYSQTNRVNHFSHSGDISTMSIFKANDNMGLNCGTPYNTEYTPDTTNVIKISDTTLKDTIKPKVCTPKNSSPTPTPRRGLSLERKFNVEDVLGKFK